MKIELEIPDAIAASLDPFLKTLESPPEVQPDGSKVTRPLFPNGVSDWVATTVQGSIEQLATQLPSPPEEVTRIRGERAAKELEWKQRMATALKPNVTSKP